MCDFLLHNNNNNYDNNNNDNNIDHDHSNMAFLSKEKKRLSKAGGFVLRENAFSSSNAYMIFIQIVAYVL